MSFVNEIVWTKVSEDSEEAIVRKITFKRQINSKTIPLECLVCTNYLVTVEDIDTFKNEKCCENCYLMYYYQNKDKWIKGWRPELKS